LPEILSDFTESGKIGALKLICLTNPSLFQIFRLHLAALVIKFLTDIIQQEDRQFCFFNEVKLLNFNQRYSLGCVFGQCSVQELLQVSEMG
jgi:hypothetical protein